MQNGGDAAEHAEGTVVAEKLQGLKIGHRVVQSWTVQTAVEQKLPAAHRQAPAHRQHGIGIIFFHRKHIGPRRGKAQGIEVPQDHIRGQA